MKSLVAVLLSVCVVQGDELQVNSTGGATQACTQRPTRFVVSGAGLEDVNGEYVLARFPSLINQNLPAYQKRGSSIFIFKWYSNCAGSSRCTGSAGHRTDFQYGYPCCPSQWAIALNFAEEESCFMYLAEGLRAQSDVPPMGGWGTRSQGQDPPPSVVEVDGEFQARQINGTALEAEPLCCDDAGVLLADAECVVEKRKCGVVESQSEYDIFISLRYGACALCICAVMLCVLCGLKERARKRLSDSWQRDGMRALEKASPSVCVAVQPGALIGKTSFQTGNTTACTPAAADDDCVICLDPLSAGPVRVLKCEHVIHAYCFDKYLICRGGPPTEWCCPICKRPVLQENPQQQP